MAPFFGLVGGKLGHSYSKLIHERLHTCEYHLVELPPEELASYIRARAFTGLNVTIPFKQAVIPLCDRLTDDARRIGAVNTLFFDRDGALTGDNTDLYGMKKMLAGFDLSGKTALVLGATGGTGKTAVCALNDLGARVIPVSRGGEVNYDTVYETRADFLINTTPVGMYPDILSSPINPNQIPGLTGVADVIYNPTRTLLLQKSEEAGHRTAGGLSMLVYQAAKAAERFLGKPLEPGRVEETLSWIARETRSIALIGMPGSGKSPVARYVAERLGRTLLDIDQIIESRLGPIPDIFARDGEARFRELEAQVIREAALARGAVIATGGGAVLREDNRQLLRANAFVVELQRPLSELATGGRPLSSGLDALQKMQVARAPLYLAARDVGIPLCSIPEETAEEVIRIFLSEVRA